MHKHNYIHPDITDLVIPGENCRYATLLKLFDIYMQTSTFFDDSNGEIQGFEIILRKLEWSYKFTVSYEMLKQLPDDIRIYTMNQEIIKGIGSICEKVINETQF